LRAVCIAPQRSLSSSSSAAQVWAGTAVATVTLTGYRFINRNRPIALP
jgi:hypothetical protein